VGRRRPFRPLRQTIEALALRALGALARSLSLERAGDLGAILGRGAHALLARRRRIATENLLQSMGPDPGGEPASVVTRRVFEQIGRSFLEFLALPAHGREGLLSRVDFVGFEPAAAWAREGRGAVLLTGHFGNWELLGAAVGMRYGKVTYLLPRQTNPKSDAYLNEVRRRLGIVPIPIGSGMRAAARALRSGAFLGMLPDQDARRVGIHVPFFGRPASTPSGPARLAWSARVPILLAVLERTGRGRFRARALRILTPDWERDRDEEIYRLTAEVTGALEEAIRERPDQWYWIHRRWKTPPPSAAHSEPPSEAAASAVRK
jgi:KDO2-lipid IV(A) lauroyltransferase